MVFMPLMYIVLIPKPTSYKVLIPKELDITYCIHPTGNTSSRVFIPNIFMGRTPLHSYCQWDTRTHDWRCHQSRSRHRDKRLRIVQFQTWQPVLGHQRCSNRSQLGLLDSWETGKSCKCCRWSRLECHTPVLAFVPEVQWLSG